MNRVPTTYTNDIDAAAPRMSIYSVEQETPADDNGWYDTVRVDASAAHAV